MMTAAEKKRVAARLRRHQRREEAAQAAALRELNESGVFDGVSIARCNLACLKEWIGKVRAILAKHGLNDRTGELLRRD